MRRLLLVVAAGTLLRGCTPLRPPPAAPPPDATTLLGRADELARRGSPREARAVYRVVLRTYRGTTAAADALYGLGQLYVDPDSPLHDWATANIAFGRLLNEYPRSRHAPGARAWRAALGELLRNQADARRLRADLERLKELDMEEEQAE
jgi:TolA-binding protein